MDLANALEAHAERGTDGSAARLGSDATKSLVRARVARGKRVHALNMSAGVAAGAAIVMVAGAWAAPHVWPAEVAPVAPSSQTPTATASPVPSPVAYIPTPYLELPAVGQPDYVAAMVGAYRTRGTVACEDVPTVPMSQQGSPFPGYVPIVPTAIWDGRFYAEDPSLSWTLLYDSANEGYGSVLQVVHEYQQLHAKESLFLIDANGGWWGYDLNVAEWDKSSSGPAGIYMHLSLKDDGCGGGGGRAAGGPIPPGFYAARQVTYLPDTNSSTVRDLGTVEIHPGPTAGS